MTLSIGSVCTGYAGLDGAVQQVFGGELAWVADPDPGAAAILKHHHPDVPNLGDITKTNWEDVEPVDLLCGGYPCQPFSDAGLRKGIEDERHIWPYIATALRVLRPRYAIFENVRGHLRRGFDVVLTNLAALGFDAEWQVVHAAEVGAPHGRPRLIVLATAQDADRPACDQRRVAAPGQAPGGRAWADAGRRGGAPASDTTGGNERQQQGARDRRAQESPGGRRALVADAQGNGRDEGRPEPARQLRRPDVAVSGDANWGQYAAAIRRWEAVLGRPAPRPTEPGRTGERLSPVFVEWLMGLPAGHVTAVPGLSRNQQLKALGNGVVPQQVAAALQILLERRAAA